MSNHQRPVPWRVSHLFVFVCVCSHLVVDVAVSKHGVEVLDALAGAAVVVVLQPFLDGAHVHGLLDDLVVVLGQRIFTFFLVLFSFDIGFKLIGWLIGYQVPPDLVIGKIHYLADMISTVAGASLKANFSPALMSSVFVFLYLFSNLRRDWSGGLKKFFN